MPEVVPDVSRGSAVTQGQSPAEGCQHKVVLLSIVATQAHVTVYLAIVDPHLKQTPVSMKRSVHFFISVHFANMRYIHVVNNKNANKIIKIIMIIIIIILIILIIIIICQSTNASRRTRALF